MRESERERERKRERERERGVRDGNAPPLLGPHHLFGGRLVVAPLELQQVGPVPLPQPPGFSREIQTRVG